MYMTSNAWMGQKPRIVRSAVVVEDDSEFSEEEESGVLDVMYCLLCLELNKRLPNKANKLSRRKKNLMVCPT